MYFTIKKQNEILRKIKNNDYDLYAIKLKIGICESDIDTLTELVDLMFLSWKKMVMYKNNNYMKNYDGIIKRLFFECTEEGFEPYFYLLCVSKKRKLNADEEYKVRIFNEKIRIQTYIKWFSSWATTLKMCTPVSVNYSLVELENLEKVISEFCTNEKYTLLPLIDSAKRELLKKASGDGKHKLVTFHGIFKNQGIEYER